METEKGWESVENWVSRLAPETGKNYRIHFKVFMRWKAENGGKFRDHTPDMMIRYQQEATGNGERFEILDMAQRYILSRKGLRVNSKRDYYRCIRSFFAHNRADLPRDKTFRIRGDVEKVRGGISPEDLRRILLACKPVYRAAFLCIFQAGLDQDGFVHWNANGLEDLRRQLRGDPRVIRIHLPGRKRGRNEEPFHTYIGADAVQAVREYFKVRPESDAGIFLNQYREPLTKNALRMYWMRVLKRVGLITPTPERGRASRYGKNIHELRDTFRSLWTKSGKNPVVAEFSMGHQVDPLMYDKACNDEDWTREEYIRAMPMLQIMSSGRPFGRVDRDEVDRLNEEVMRLRGELDAANRQLESMTPIGAEVARLLSDPIVVEALRGLAEERRKRP